MPTRASQAATPPRAFPRTRQGPKAAPSSHPVASVIRLQRSPLAKLAWIFGFGR